MNSGKLLSFLFLLAFARSISGAEQASFLFRSPGEAVQEYVSPKSIRDYLLELWNHPAVRPHQKKIKIAAALTPPVVFLWRLYRGGRNNEFEPPRNDHKLSFAIEENDRQAIAAILKVIDQPTLNQMSLRGAVFRFPGSRDQQFEIVKQLLARGAAPSNLHIDSTTLEQINSIPPRILNLFLQHGMSRLHTRLPIDAHVERFFYNFNEPARADAELSLLIPFIKGRNAANALVSLRHRPEEHIEDRTINIVRRREPQTRYVVLETVPNIPMLTAEDRKFLKGLLERQAQHYGPIIFELLKKFDPESNSYVQRVPLPLAKHIASFLSTRTCANLALANLTVFRDAKIPPQFWPCGFELIMSGAVRQRQPSALAYIPIGSADQQLAELWAEEQGAGAPASAGPGLQAGYDAKEFEPQPLSRFSAASCEGPF